MEIEKLLLKVLDAPTTYRLVIDTGLPSLMTKKWILSDLEDCQNEMETLYYMIDRSSDEGQTVSEAWIVNTSLGSSDSIPTNELLLKLISIITDRCPKADIHIETY